MKRPDKPSMIDCLQPLIQCEIYTFWWSEIKSFNALIVHFDVFESQLANV